MVGPGGINSYVDRGEGNGSREIGGLGVDEKEIRYRV